MSSTADSHQVDICKLCELKPSKYCCPRCGVFYCSVDCYKSEQHLQCSESFYKDCITDEMGSMMPDVDGKQKMMEILKKLHNEGNSEMDNPENLMHMLNESFNGIGLAGNFSGDGSLPMDEDMNDKVDSDDGDSIPDMHTRFQEVDMEDSDAIWKHLTEDEKKEFVSMVNSGDISTLLSYWEPWWKYHKEKKLVEEIVDGSKIVRNDADYREDCPNVLMNINDFSTITKQNPAACVKFNLLNILSSYVVILRHFNGDHHDFTAEAASCLTSICSNLKKGANFEDADSAMESVTQECLNNAFIASDSETQKLMKQDLKCVIRGPEDSNKSFYMMCALSDIHSLFNDARKPDKKGAERSQSEFSRRFPDHKNVNLPLISKDLLANYIKKIEYYLSYLKTYANELEFSLNKYQFLYTN